MAVELDFDWTTSDKDDQVDRLDRGKYAKFLTDYLRSYTDNRYKNDSYVMNLNAEWGAGKTWFLKRWQQTIRNQHPTAYIDAWQNDFSDDPLLTVIAGISDALKAYPNVSSYQYTKKVAKTGGRFLKQAAPVFLNALMKHYTGLDSKNFKLEDFGDFAEKALEASLDDHNAKVRDIEGFKSAISDWINKAVGSRADGSPGKPMFVFIDELDRCRPTYAIELLETVKHLFDIKGLVFVIATNTDQLQHSIKAVYGQEFDAQRYLYRFFNRSFRLKKPDLLAFIQVQPVFKAYFSKALLSTCDGNVTVENEDVLATNFAAIAESFDFDLRTTLQWMEQLHACYSEGRNLNKYFWLVTAILLAMKISSPDLFSKFITRYGGFEYQKRPDVREFDHQFFDNQPSTREILFAVKPTHLHGVRITGNDRQERSFRDQMNTGSYSVRSSARILEELHGAFMSRSNEDLDIYRTRLAQQAYNGRPAALGIALHYCAQIHGATYQGYIDLVELASDLT